MTERLFFFVDCTAKQPHNNMISAQTCVKLIFNLIHVTASDTADFDSSGKSTLIYSTVRRC